MSFVARLYAELWSTMIIFADAEKEIRSWPCTHGLGCTERTQELLDELLEIADRKSDAIS
ncbi:MAG: hypothetical protein ACRDTH_17435 [Pseudonocardiaceae bacterium]